ncbi:MAG: chromosomal replication initiator DnaA [Rubellimicrobium sp.]|nr:chromosomal replication initiator DnaA [Rubellimicrobium sp.]
MTRQLTFDLPGAEAMGPGDFFVSASNAAAHAMVTGGARWPGGRLALIGPPGSGKTHLARIHAAATGATVIAARDLRPTPLPAPLPAPDARLVIEDMEHLPQASEEWLFHLLNHLGAGGGHILLTAATAPARWPVALPDLASRLQAVTPVRIGDPDDALLFAVMAKLLADRQIAPEPGLVPWLVPRIERSFAAARRVVALLDAACLSEGRALTRTFAREVLTRRAAGPDLFNPDALDKDGEAPQ